MVAKSLSTPPSPSFLSNYSRLLLFGLLLGGGISVTACGDTDTNESSIDAGTPDATLILVPASGLYRMGMVVVEAGNVEIEFQASLQSDPVAGTIPTFEIRAVGSDGSLSEVLISQSDIPVTDGKFEAAFAEFTIPGAFSVTGGDVVTSFTLAADIGQDNFFCGGVTGAIPTFSLTLTDSLFGAIPWLDGDQKTRFGCGPPEDEGTQEATIGGARPATLVMPEGHTDEALPVVVLLHGFGTTGATQDAYFGLSKRVASEKFLLVIPDGTPDSEGMRFWNATLCCDFENNGVDDVAYILSLVDETIAMYGGITTEVHLIGHSNGGFMASRIACDAADRINSFVSVAGSSYVSADDCQPTKVVNKLHIHGTLDETIPYDGGSLGPGAVTLSDRWAAFNGCGKSSKSPARDIVSTIDGLETTVAVYQGCDLGGSVELWTMTGGGHVPTLQADFADQVLSFVLN